MTRPSHHPLAPGVARTPSGSFEGWVLYAPSGCWLALLAQGWRLPWVADTCDVGGWSVLLERDA